MTDKWVHIKGCPGAGKTYTLIQIVKELTGVEQRSFIRSSDVYNINNICFLSFTKFAAEEAKSRAISEFTVNDTSNLKFSTIHSMCFRLLGVKRQGGVVKTSKSNSLWAAYCKIRSVTIQSEDPDKDNFDEDSGSIYVEETENSEAGDVASFMSYARNTQPLITDFTQIANRWFITSKRRVSSERLAHLSQEWVGLLPNLFLPDPKSKAKDKYESVIKECVSRGSHDGSLDGMYDFTRMVEECARRPGLTPCGIGAKVLLLDEGQDISPLQHAVLRHWAGDPDMEHRFTSYDIDQTIFGFQGADPRLMINLPIEYEIHLKMSRRCPTLIVDLAKKIIEPNTFKTNIDWKSASSIQPGRIEKLNSIPYDRIVEAESKNQTTMILVRNRYMFQKYEIVDDLMAKGIRFKNLRGVEGLPPKGVAVPSLIELHRYGQMKSPDSMKTLIKNLPGHIFVGYRGRKGLNQAAFKKLSDEQTPTSINDLVNYGVKNDVIEKLGTDFLYGLRLVYEKTKNSGDMLDYFSLIYKKYGLKAFYEEPKITISTVHGVKGGEADNIIVLTEMTNRTYSSYMREPDEERCLWFVAVSRSKKYLGVIMPPSGMPQFHEMNRWL